MLDAIFMYVKRLFPVRTVAGALSQFISPKLVASCNSSADEKSCLISMVSQSANLDPLASLYEVADRLDLPPCHEYDVPSRELVEMTGHSYELLRESGVVPQWLDDGQAGYSLVIADPLNVDLVEYREKGIPVFLGLRSSIAEAWASYDALDLQSREKEISHEQFESVMLQLAHDALEQGASEVFVGHPEPSGYEFLVAEHRYTGRLDPRVYRKLLQKFTAQGRLQHRITIDVLSAKLKELSFALTKNVNNPVVYLSWTLNSSDTTESSATIDATTQASAVDAAEESSSISSVSKHFSKGATADVSPSDNSSILLVDDDERFGALLLRILKARGFDVHRCANGQKALDYLRESDVTPSLVISDVHMPTMDGVTFLQNLRKTLPLLPVLMLTSDEDDLLQVELVELGANAFVRKQDDIKILIAWCNNLISAKDDSFEHVVRVSA
jgi:CheY-like chemotaxis protein